MFFLIEYSDTGQEGGIMKKQTSIFTRNFRRIHKASGMSAYKMARLTGFSEASLSRWLSGKRTPHLGNIEILSLQYAVPMSAFFEEQNKCI